MATYQIDTEDGHTYEIETEDQQPPQDKPWYGKAWDALAVPEQKSREGLNMLSNAIPFGQPGSETGNVAWDITKGIPRVAAQSLAEVAPGFISRGSLATMGALKGAQMASPVIAPVVNTIGRGIANQAEQLSGAVPGALQAAYNDSKLMLTAGRKAAQPLYEAAKAEIPQGTNLFQGMYKPHEIIDAAQDYLSKGGVLEPAEALIARKAVGVAMKSGQYVKDSLVELRNTLDGMAKASENLSQADVLHKAGLQAESLRNLFPQNKLGGASAFKLGIITALENMGPAGKAIGAGLSPSLQGATATGLGIGARQIVNPLLRSPQLGSAIGLGSSNQ